MISLLEDLVSFIEGIGELALWAGETVINLIGEAFGAVFLGAVALLPSLPETFAPPTIVAWLNWFFPVGAFVATGTTLMGCYVTFLALRWVFTKAGVL